MDIKADPRSSRATAIWLAAVALMVLAMVVVGGATRATGSGLSITQWKPVSGVVPPLGHDAWERMFALYRTTPQYRLENAGMSLAAFQSIFWWEWAHRLLGRLVGFVFFVPFVVLLAKRRLPRRLIGRCLVLFAFGGLQGAVGWWMVTSGLEGRTSVAPERLAAHLGLGLILFAALIWTALEAMSGPNRRRAEGRWTLAAWAFLAGVYAQCLLGALVAGNHAGLVDADWPLMGGRLFPDDYWRGGIWSTFVHGRAATQFDHRMLAYGLVAGGLLLAKAAWRTPALRGLGLTIAILSTAQAALGVANLLLTVPLALALAHQVLAVLILGCATAFAWRARRIHAVF